MAGEDPRKPIPPAVPNRPRVEAENGQRVDLYSLLMPEIQVEDKRNPIQTFDENWDFPEGNEFTEWDQEGAVWDKVGPRPVIQNLFWAIERLEGEDLVALDSFKDLLNPDTAPAQFLPLMAESLGLALPDNATELKQRAIIRGLMDLYKTRGRKLSWKGFFRLIGLDVEVIPLHKDKLLADRNENYSQVRYETERVEGEFVGPSGNAAYSGFLQRAPIRPGTVIFTDGDEVWRDVELGVLLGSKGGTGTVVYADGRFELFKKEGDTAPGTVTSDYDSVSKEFPFQAARVDLDVFLLPFDTETGTVFEPNCNTPPEGELLEFVDDQFIDRLKRHMEQFRPIHVLLRTLALQVQLDEELCDWASDRVVCGPDKLLDDRSEFENVMKFEQVPVPAFQIGETITQAVSGASVKVIAVGAPGVYAVGPQVTPPEFNDQDSVTGDMGGGGTTPGVPISLPNGRLKETAASLVDQVFGPDSDLSVFEDAPGTGETGGGVVAGTTAATLIPPRDEMGVFACGDPLRITFSDGQPTVHA